MTTILQLAIVWAVCVFISLLISLKWVAKKPAPEQARFARQMACLGPLGLLITLVAWAFVTDEEREEG